MDKIWVKRKVPIIIAIVLLYTASMFSILSAEETKSNDVKVDNGQETKVPVKELKPNESKLGNVQGEESPVKPSKSEEMKVKQKQGDQVPIVKSKPDEFTPEEVQPGETKINEMEEKKIEIESVKTDEMQVGEKNYVTLRTGTAIMLEFLETVDSNNFSVGQSIPMFVTKSVSVDDHVVIMAGTEVFAKVAERKEAGSWGARGKIRIACQSCYSVDDQEIMISASQFSEGKSKGGEAAGVAIATGLLCLPAAASGFAVKGEEGIIPAGTTIKATVDTDYKVTILSEEELERKLVRTSERLAEYKRKIEEDRLKREEEKRKKEEVADVTWGDDY